MQPLDPKERIELLKALRGFALLVILFNNILFFGGHAYQPIDELTRNPSYLLDDRLFYFLDIVVTAKFYTLFSILFAAGFYLQLKVCKSAYDIWVGVAF